MARSKFTLRLDKVDACANFCGGRRSQHVLIGDYVEQTWTSPRSQFLLFGVEGLLIEVARLDSGGEGDTGLFEKDLCIMDINRGVVSGLAVASFVLRSSSIAVTLLA